jgi:hypothetical protein
MKPTLEQLESRLAPTVDIVYGGGPTIPHVQVADLHTDPSMAAYSDQAMQVILSQYLPLLTPYYGVGAGSLNASVNVTPLPGPNLLDAQIQKAITAEIQSGAVQPPSASQLYVYFLSPNQVVTDEGGAANGGYHGTFQLNGQPVYYAVIYDAGTSIPGYLVPAIASHEIAESVTDPAPYSGWTDASTHDEIDDVYAWRFMFTLNGFYMMAPSGPTGQIIQPNGQQSDPPQPLSPPQQQQPNPFVELSQLSAIPLEQFNALAYRVLALIDPRDFAARAAAAQQQLEQNPMLPTPKGQQRVALGWAMFAQVLSQ